MKSGKAREIGEWKQQSDDNKGGQKWLRFVGLAKAKGEALITFQKEIS